MYFGVEFEVGDNESIFSSNEQQKVVTVLGNIVTGVAPGIPRHWG